MKARSGSYDNDPWGSARNSRSGSKETLNTTGYGTTAYNNTVNGCKDPPCPLRIALFVSCSFCFCKFMNACTSDCIPVQPCLRPSQCDRIYVATRAFYEPQYLLSLGFEVRAVRLRMQVSEGHGCCRRGRFIEMESCWDS